LRCTPTWDWHKEMPPLGCFGGLAANEVMQQRQHMGRGWKAGNSALSLQHGVFVVLKNKR
jgi:hypothetical protein